MEDPSSSNRTGVDISAKYIFTAKSVKLIDSSFQTTFMNVVRWVVRSADGCGK